MRITEWDFGTVARLKCGLSPGMFSDEIVVRYFCPDFLSRSFFVPREFVQEEASLVRVKIYRGNGAIWATLPDDVQSVIEVSVLDIIW